MCGIVGYVGGGEDAVPLLVDGLRRLECRGYDSAGIAIAEGGAIRRQRAEGKLANLAELLSAEPLRGPVGLGHTRWATHGRPNEENAHPHTDCTGQVVVVHNGIIENYLEIKERLSGQGHRFVTETDTEVVAHLIEAHLEEGILAAVQAAVKELQGAYALAVLSAREPDRIVAAKTGPPLVVGVGKGEHLVASDIPALLPRTRQVFHLEDGEVALLTAGDVRVWNTRGVVPREPEIVQWDAAQVEKGPYRHFMLKEIYEQPLAVRDTVMGKVSAEEGRVWLPDLGLTEEDATGVRRVTMGACGTSWHAALVGRYLVESLAGLPVAVDVASDYRYRQAPIGEGELVVALSQSGETADRVDQPCIFCSGTRHIRLYRRRQYVVGGSTFGATGC